MSHTAGDSLRPLWTSPMYFQLTLLEGGAFSELSLVSVCDFSHHKVWAVLPGRNRETEMEKYKVL